jgi:threonine synthase
MTGELSRRFDCSRCAAHFPIDTFEVRCRRCGSPLTISPPSAFTRYEIETQTRSLWRYRKALAVDEGEVVSLGEGCTPLIEAPWMGRRTLFKLDFMNPSGSFKDRGTSALLTYLLQRGIHAVAEDSSGNAGASVSIYAARAGIDCRIVTQATASPSKLLQSRAAGARVETVVGSREMAAEAAGDGSDGYVYAGHNWSAHFLEGTKTVGYELWEDLGFRAPDNVVVPLGGGSNVLGCHFAFRDLMASREITKLPRIFGIQAESCAPLHAAFGVERSEIERCNVRPTIAEGIALTNPPRAREILSALKACDGGTVAVADADIITAASQLARLGIFVEPTAAAAVAGLTALMISSRIRLDEVTIVVLTGSGLKTPDAWREIIALGSDSRL